MQDALLPRVQSAFQHAFNLDDPRSITLDTQRGDIPRWDSYGHATLALSLEREFDITLDVDDLTALENVREIIRVVGLKLGAAGVSAALSVHVHLSHAPASGATGGRVSEI